MTKRWMAGGLIVVATVGSCSAPKRDLGNGAGESAAAAAGEGGSDDATAAAGAAGAADSGNAGSAGETSSTDACTGKVCNAPPSNDCQSSSSFTAYDAVGSGCGSIGAAGRLASS